MKEITNRLFALRDEGFKEFNSKLMPTVDPGTVIGVRTPLLRQMAKAIAKEPCAGEFLKELPHRYFEENCLHAFIIETIPDYGECAKELERFLPFIDNWSTCDMLSPKVFAVNKGPLFAKIRQWIASDRTYTVRFGVNMLIKHFLDDDFTPECLDLVAGIVSDEYYVKMVVAWYFATALAKQYEAAVPYIEQKRLEVWTHNKAIQKSIESRRITPEQKEYLRGFKIR